MEQVFRRFHCGAGQINLNTFSIAKGQMLESTLHWNTKQITHTHVCKLEWLYKTETCILSKTSYHQNVSPKCTTS